MVNNNRFIIGLIILSLTVFFYLIQIDKLFFFIVSALIISEIYKINIGYKFLFFCLLVLYLLNGYFFLEIQIFDKVLPFLIILLILLNIFYRNFKSQIFSFIVLLSTLVFFDLIFNERNLLFFCLFFAYFNDTVAYIFGSLIKGPQISPKISPNKTWSGTLFSFSFTGILIFFMNFNIILAFIASLSLFFGDLYFSYIKRKIKIKDFSNILSSHGGVLDRYDSIMFIIIIMKISLLI